MASIENLIKQAKAMGGGSVLLTPHAEPRAKTMNGWLPIQKDRYDASNVRDMLFEMLTEAQKQELSQRGVSIGSVGLADGNNISFQVYKHKLGYGGLIREVAFGTEHLPESQISVAVFDQLAKGPGAFFVTGPSGSGKSTTLARMVDKINTEKACNISLFEKSIGIVHRPKMSVINHFEIGNTELDKNWWTQVLDSDVVALDLPFSYPLIDGVLHLAEAGKKVIVSMMLDGIGSLIGKIGQATMADQRAFVMDRLASQIKLFLNLRLLQGTSDDHVMVYEAIFFNEALRASLKKQDISYMYRLISETSEKTGMKSLNQALLQMCIRRKIDLKTAFTASTNPDELDSLFSRMEV